MIKDLKKETNMTCGFLGYQASGVEFSGRRLKADILRLIGAINRHLGGKDDKSGCMLWASSQNVTRMKLQARRLIDDDPSSRITIKTCDNDDVAPSPELNHDVLFLIIKHLGVIDFVSFSGVCKSWRSFAHSNRKMFMASKPPMYMRIYGAYKKECYCYLEDFEGRVLKTLIPHSAGRKFVGLIGGYLVLFGRKTKDLWLVNPITSRQFHFPNVPFSPSRWFRGVVVFSPSISGWLFVVTNGFYNKIWFGIAGKGEWNYVEPTDLIENIVAFKGKIYIANMHVSGFNDGQLWELKLNPEPELTLLKTKNFPMLDTVQFLSYGENLLLIGYKYYQYVYKVHELDFGEMKWVCTDKASEEYALLFKYASHNSTARKQESSWWWWPGTNKNKKDGLNLAPMWYFLHECLDDNLID